MTRHHRKSDRGATLVEYSLLAGVLVVGLIGVVSRVQDSSEDRLNERAGAIGHPAESVPPPGPSTTSTLPPTPTVTTATTTTTPYNPTFSVSCTGTTGSNNVCTITLTPAPPAVPTWTIIPNSGFSGMTPVGNDLQVQFDQSGAFSVRANINGFEYPRTVTCRTVGQSGNVNCS